MINKTVVILANSVKHNEHCVAGKCLTTGEWVRPVSSVEGGELTNQQSTYVNPHGNYIVKPLQKIEMNLLSQAPLINQPENYLISDNKWVQRYKIEKNELLNFTETPQNLWGVGNRVDYNSIETGIFPINQSLYLVQVDRLQLFRNEDDKRRASFVYNNESYELPVTDPNFDNLLADDEELMGILCVSLGEEYNGYCYKLIATVF